MKKVYDRFADEYIDESEKNPYAPPERYTEITEEVLVENAARWFLTALKRLLDEEADRKTEPTHGKMLICPSCGLEVHSDFDSCPRCGADMTEREGE